jgi:alanine dehydrogenase
MSVKRREAILASASTLPFALALADKGWRKALKDDPNRRAGREHIGRATGLRPIPGDTTWGANRGK